MYRQSSSSKSNDSKSQNKSLAKNPLGKFGKSIQGGIIGGLSSLKINDNHSDSSSEKDSSFDDGFLDLKQMKKILSIINKDLPEEEKIQLLESRNEKDEIATENIIKKYQGEYKKYIIVHLEENDTLGHADPFLVSTVDKNNSDVYFFYPPSMTQPSFVEKKKEGINVKIFNSTSENHEMLNSHPQADYESCFSLAVATLKDMTKQKFEKNMKNNTSLVYLPTSLKKYAQGSKFVREFSNPEKDIVVNKKTREKLTVAQYRETKKKEGSGESKKLSEFSRKILKNRHLKDFSLSDLSSFESHESKKEQKETLETIEKEGRERNRNRNIKNKKITIGLNRSRSSSDISSSS